MREKEKGKQVRQKQSVRETENEGGRPRVRTTRKREGRPVRKRETEGVSE